MKLKDGTEIGEGKVEVVRVHYNPPGTYDKDVGKVFESYYEHRYRPVQAKMSPHKCSKTGGHHFFCYSQGPGWMEYGCAKCAAMLRLPNEIWG